MSKLRPVAREYIRVECRVSVHVVAAAGLEGSGVPG